MTRAYSDESLNGVQQVPLSGNDQTTLLLTPQAGTGAETKTHTTTCKYVSLGRKAVLKKLLYVIDTAQTGAGNNLALDIYKNGASIGSLAVTTETAGTPCLSSAINNELAAVDYLQIVAKSTTTASDANAAKGTLHVLYGERYVDGN